MYIEVKKKSNGKYEVTPNVEVQTTLADITPMSAEISSYDNVYVFLGLPEQAQQFDESVNVDLWMNSDGYYDSVNKTYFANNYEKVMYLEDGHYIRSGDKIYQVCGNDAFAPANIFNMVESDITVKLNDTVISPGITHFHNGDSVTIEPVSGKVCSYEDAGTTGFSVLSGPETVSLMDYDHRFIVVSKDETNNTFSFAKYVLMYN